MIYCYTLFNSSKGFLCTRQSLATYVSQIGLADSRSFMVVVFILSGSLMVVFTPTGLDDKKMAKLGSGFVMHAHKARCPT